MKFFCLFSSMAAVSTALAMPTVGNVEVVQGADRVVKVSYDLSGGPAIITFDVTTNGVSLGDRAFDRAWGAVNSLVTNETGRLTFKWLPESEIPSDMIAGGASVDVRAWSPDSPPDYAVFDTVCKSNVNYYVSAERLPGGIGSDTYRKEKLVMRKIPAAGVRWQMGSPSWQLGRGGLSVTNETLRWVTLSEDYYMSVFELTQGQYLRLRRIFSTRVPLPDSSLAQCNTNFCSDADLFPVSNIKRTEFRGSAADGFSWPQNGHAVNSDLFLGRMRRATGFEFDLPTHAQWEYACRAGQSAAVYNGRELHSANGSVADAALTNIAWYAGYLLQGLNKKAPVGMLEPNAWGLYDMLGNVWEFVLDRQGGIRPSTDVTDPTGPSSGSQYKQVGASYWQGVDSLRCAFSRSLAETSAGTDYGFRLCCPVNRTWKVPVVAAE